jgi:hypothetical protein
MVRIPGEVHILMRPEGGWIDVETLWHELGHGLSAVATDPSLPAVDRELATTFNLSEAYAFTACSAWPCPAGAGIGDGAARKPPP